MPSLHQTASHKRARPIPATLVSKNVRGKEGERGVGRGSLAIASMEPTTAHLQVGAAQAR